MKKLLITFSILCISLTTFAISDDALKSSTSTNATIVNDNEEHFWAHTALLEREENGELKDDLYLEQEKIFQEHLKLVAKTSGIAIAGAIAGACVVSGSIISMIIRNYPL